MTVVPNEEEEEEHDEMRHLLVDADEMLDLQEFEGMNRKYSEALRESIRIHADEYRIESTAMDTELKSIGVDVCSLPGEMSELLNNLADCAMALNARDAHPSTLNLNLVDLQVELSQHELQYTQLASKLSSVERRKNAATSRMALLYRHLQHYEAGKDTV